MRTSWPSRPPAPAAAHAAGSTTSNQRHNVYKDVVCYHYYITTIYVAVWQGKSVHVMLIGLLDGRLCGGGRGWCGVIQWGEKPDLLNCLCMITSSAKQSSAFSDIVAILSIMAKVSLSRQMSRKYILYISLGHLLFFPVGMSYYLMTEKRSSDFLHLAKYRKQSFSINFVGTRSSSFFCLVE